jgi:hypothetical protein
VYIIGQHGASIVLAFMVSSQSHHKGTALDKEVVVIPRQSTAIFSQESYIQCFHEVERLDSNELENGLAKGEISQLGRLKAAYLYKVKKVVKDSDVLSQQDIKDCLAALPADDPASIEMPQ